MSTLPAFVTTYEILRSNDYVMITFSTPTGEVRDGQMVTQEVQKLAFTYPRFLEFAATISMIENTVRRPEAGKPSPPAKAAREQRAVDAEPDNDLRAGAVAGRIVRH